MKLKKINIFDNYKNNNLKLKVRNLQEIPKDILLSIDSEGLIESIYTFTAYHEGLGLWSSDKFTIVYYKNGGGSVNSLHFGDINCEFSFSPAKRKFLMKRGREITIRRIV
jgi:hypothetical protein